LMNVSASSEGVGKQDYKHDVLNDGGKQYL
jgi:hypothetical protein